jgi:hypothetical protein
MEEILALIKREALVSKALVPEETVLYFANQVLNK